MKAVAVMVCLLFLFGCSKEKTENGLSDLNGLWELRVSDGGYSYAHKTYPADNGNTYTFSGSNQYQKEYGINGESSSVSGTYSVVSGNTTCDNKQVKFIRFSDTEPASASIVSFAGDSLCIKVDNCVVADGIDYTYVKIQQSPSGR